PLLGVFIDYKVKKLLLTNHYYQVQDYEDLTPEEKALVYEKPGTYHRVLLGASLSSYVIRECDLIAIEVVRGRLETPQDITNLPDLRKMSPDDYEEILWLKNEYKVK